MTTYCFEPPATASLPIEGRAEHFPVRRILCIGRNDHAHAKEMGWTVDKSTAQPFYFTKSLTALVASPAVVPFPPRTQDYQHEVELVVAIGAAGHQVAVQDAAQLVFGYGVGLDMTRRDLQWAAKQAGLPWDTGKDVEGGSVCSAIVPMPGQLLRGGDITLQVNGQQRQAGNISQLIWGVDEIIADLSTYYHLQPGDLIYTGTPQGVGPVHAGDVLEGQVQGVGTVRLQLI